MLIILLSTISTQARKFYFSTSGSDSYTTTQAQNSATPWKTLVKLNDFADNGAAAGDTFLFKRGDVFANGANQRISFKWFGNSEGYTCATGTANAPIVFTYYGDLALERPNFLFPFPSSVSNTDRYNMCFKNVSYFVFDGLQFNDTRFPVLDKRTSCYTATGLMFGESMSSGVDHFTVKNCNFSNIGYGILANGSDFIIDNNTFTNFKSVGDTLGTFDIGADALQISGKKYRITNNYISGSWAYANPYNSSSNGLLGGALETINDFDSSFIAYNTFIDNSGGMEFGQNAGTQYGPNDDTFAYNFFINNSNVSYVNTTGTFRCAASKLHFWNNVIIENEKSRFTGRNNGGDALGNGQTYTSSGFIYWPPLPPSKSTFQPDSLNYYSSWRTFDCGDQLQGNVGDTLYDIKNNIIWNTNGLQLKSSVERRPRDFYRNNIYHIKGSYQQATNLGDGAVLSTDEKIINTDLFKDTSSAFPQNWDFHIIKDTSYAYLSRYVNVGLTRDYSGNLLSATPTIGVYQYIPSSNSNLQATSNYTTVLCNGGNSTVTVSASGGTPPYTGVGTFTRTSGSYSYVVTDATQARSTTSGVISQPSALSGTVNWVDGLSTTITANITASGGTPPYRYSIVDGKESTKPGTGFKIINQVSNILTGFPYGSATITIIDDNNCQYTIQETINNIGIPTGRTFYVSNSGSDSYTTTQAQNPSTPWATLSKVQSSLSSFTSGDRILFAKGGKFTGTLNIYGKTNLYFGSYGSGNKPLFWGTGANIVGLVTLTTCSGITFDGWNISDTTISITDRTVQAKIQNVFIIQTSSQTNTVKNCTMDRMGYGVYVTSSSRGQTVTGCDIGNLRMIKNTPTSVNPDDDYGGVPVQLSSSNNTVTNNYFHDCYAVSYDYGYDGGGVEFFEEGDTVNNNIIMYNTFYDCNGIVEFGSNNDGIANFLQANNVIAYNKIINSSSLVYINNNGQYKTDVRNLQFYNNVILQTVTSRTEESNMISMATSDATAGIVVIKNNIFHLSNGVAVARTGQWTAGQLTHTNNIYRLSNGSVANFTLGGTETGTGGKLWTDTSNVNPLYWNYGLLSNASSAINSGVNVGFTRDFNNQIVSNPPDIGILEYNSTPVACTSWVYSAWSSNCLNSIQTRTATGSPSGCTGTPDSSLTRSCVVPTCSFTYSAWSTCTNGTQTRTYTSTPAGCTGTPDSSLTRSCTVPVVISKFSYSSKDKRISITCNVSGTMIIKKGNTVVRTVNYAANGTTVSVSGLAIGTYTASTYGSTITFKR